MTLQIIIYFLVFIYGIVIGSFLNVCIYRIPKHESLSKRRSHCMNCGYQLKWYDLVPVFSWVFLRGRCRKCKEKISVQYPCVELLNGILWVVTFIIYGVTPISVIYSLMISGLIVLSVIDFRTYEIPLGINVYLGIVGFAREIFDGFHPYTILLDFCIVSVFLLIVYLITKGQGIGGGDIKLMAVAGLLLGWKLVLVAFIFGCLYGCVIHIIRMKVGKADHMLAMGPYLSAGMLTAAWFGNEIIAWYTANWIQR